MASRSGCLILINEVHPRAAGVDDRSEELTAAGYTVKRLGGDLPPDAARSSAATQALDEGFDELLWVDDDVAFGPDDIDALLRCEGAVVSGVRKPLLSDGSAPGPSGLIRSDVIDFAFALTRRPAFEAIQGLGSLPRCASDTSQGFVPYFLPMAVPDGQGGHAYLNAEEAFCRRARNSGVPIMVAPWLGAGRLDGAAGYEAMTEPELNEARFDRPDGPGVSRKFVICATQRGGAFLLCRQLVNAGVGVPHEYFNPGYRGPISARWGVGGAGDRDYLAAAYRHRTTPNGVWGVQIPWWQFTRLSRDARNDLLRGAVPVFVYRRDVLGQAVAAHLAAADDRSDDEAAVREMGGYIRAEVRAWRGLFGRRGLKPIEVDYESLAADQTAAVRKIASALGLAPSDYTVPPPERPTAGDSAAGRAEAALLARLRSAPAGANADPGRPAPDRLRIEPAKPLPADFPKIKAYVVTYAKNLESARLTVKDLRQSDWGEEPSVFVQPEEWPVGFDSAAANYRRILNRAIEDRCDFALILEDDVRVCRHLRHNLTTLPLVRRDQCDFLSLYIPDLIASPWERSEPHLGYRLAKRLYSGPNQLWTRSRLWGSQACLLSRRFIGAALERWDRLEKGLDSRLISVCSELQLPMWYTAPCWVEHAPLRSAHNTPAARAPDFDREFRLTIGEGFHPPEAVPGWLTREEGELLRRVAAGRRVIEISDSWGRSTVCLAQLADQVDCLHPGGDELDEWCRRFGVMGRVRPHGAANPVFAAGGIAPVYALAFIDGKHDSEGVSRDIDRVLPLLEPGGMIAFHDYPDPGWPDVRRVVDSRAADLGWRRYAQADFLGVFTTSRN